MTPGAEECNSVMECLPYWYEALNLFSGTVSHIQDQLLWHIHVQSWILQQITMSIDVKTPKSMGTECASTTTKQMTPCYYNKKGSNLSQNSAIPNARITLYLLGVLPPCIILVNVRKTHLVFLALQVYNGFQTYPLPIYNISRAYYLIIYTSPMARNSLNWKMEIIQYYEGTT